MTSTTPFPNTFPLNSVFSRILKITLTVKAPLGMNTINRDTMNSNVFKDFLTALTTET